MMRKEKRFMTLFASFVLLGCTIFTSGCMGEGGQNTTAVPTFQPDILDKTIIYPPPGEEGSSPPFLFDFDTENASGFEEVRTDQPGTPTLVLGPDASATLPIIVSSEANTSIDIKITRTDGLPDRVQVSYTPDSFTLKAGEKTCLEMRLASSENLTVPAETAVVVWMEGAGWKVGRRGFRLGEVP